MALWHFTNLNKYGNTRSRIFHRPDGEAFGFNPNGFGSFVAVRRYKYEYNHPVMPPTILELNGKTYLMPLWKEVVEGTTINDIEWIKPKPKKQVKQKPIIETNVSGSGLGEYTTKYYPESGKFHCTCPGYWRSGGNCKHVKAMREKLGVAK